jgi:hypothetical protein
LIEYPPEPSVDIAWQIASNTGMPASAISTPHSTVSPP